MLEVFAVRALDMSDVRAMWGAGHTMSSIEWMLSSFITERLRELTREVFLSLPEEDQNHLLALPTGASDTYRPGTWSYGRRAMAWASYNPGDPDFYSITLSIPMLEGESDGFCCHTIAHEFAHVRLGHPKIRQGLSVDKRELVSSQQDHEADELVMDWGYPDPQSSAGR